MSEVREEGRFDLGFVAQVFEMRQDCLDFFLGAAIDGGYETDGFDPTDEAPQFIVIGMLARVFELPSDRCTCKALRKWYKSPISSS